MPKVENKMICWIEDLKNGDLLLLQNFATDYFSILFYLFERKNYSEREED